MSGIFGGGRPAPTQAQKDAEAAQAKAEQKAEAQNKFEMKSAMKRRRLMKTGGLKLLFSPAKLEGPGDLPKTSKLGGGT